MAVSQIEEKILGRLAKDSAPSNPLLSASLYQLLGLSILLSRKLYRARKLRRLDITRDTRSLQLYHQIIWLAREGLSITEVYILPYCQDGEEGPECRVMAAKLRASLYHVFCLFHNHPPVSQLGARANEPKSPLSNPRSPKDRDPHSRQSPNKSTNKTGREGSRRRRRSSRSALRDPIPSMTSDASYVTNPYAAGPSRSPPPADARRIPSRPPGLHPVSVAPAQAAASFLLPPLNFVPMAGEHFDATQQLASQLLPASHALRLSVALEHAAFVWDCGREHDRARRLARRAITDVYASPDGLDDDEFADASALVQALGGIVRRASADSTPRSAAPSPRRDPPSPHSPPQPQRPRVPHTAVDRAIAVSPPTASRRGASSTHAISGRGPATALDSPPNARSATHTPERLSTVPEDPSQETSETTAPTTLSPPTSRLSSRGPGGGGGGGSGRQRRGSEASVGSDKAAKRRAVERAEELYRRDSQGRGARADGSGGGNGIGIGSVNGNGNRDGNKNVDGNSVGAVGSRRREAEAETATGSRRRDGHGGGGGGDVDDPFTSRRDSAAGGGGGGDGGGGGGGAAAAAGDGGSGSGRSSRQATPPDEYVRKPSSTLPTTTISPTTNTTDTTKRSPRRTGR